MRKAELQRQQAEARRHQQRRDIQSLKRAENYLAGMPVFDNNWLRNKGIIPPPPHVMPRHKRNHKRWAFKPY